MSLTRGSARSMATAWPDSGTRCSFPPFIRTAGTVHIAASKSISSQRAPDLARPRRFQDAELDCARSAPSTRMQLAHELANFRRRQGGVVRNFRNFRNLRRIGQQVIEMSAQRAGFSPVRNLLTVAQAKMFSIRLRILVAVLVF